MRRALSCVVAAFALALAGCGEGDLVLQTTFVDEAVARYQAGLTVGQAGGCSTSVVQGLTDQLIEELNCVAPNLMVDFSGAHTHLYSAVNPFLAPGAASALEAAAVQKNDTITISSAYRSLAQQYLLYKWWQAGQCGIQLAAVPGSSNHQSGRAIDTPYYSYWKSALASQGWSWLGSSDVVHFDYTASPNVAQKSILAFQKLWNRNRSNKLVEDGVWGPATQSAMASAPTSGFSVHGCQTTGKLKGAIFQAGNTQDRVQGATVTLGNKTKVTGTDGLYVFDVAPGPYTVMVSKAGFSSNSVTRTVVAGGTVWGSMEINPVATTGTLRGVVKDAESGAAIEGAEVVAGGKSKTTAGDGAFSVSLPAGTHTLTVTRAGYQTASSQQAVTAGEETAVEVLLTPAQVDAPPVLEVTTPVSGAESDLATVTLAGTAADDGPLDGVSVSLNGGPAVDVPVEAGTFSVPVKLAPGMNEVLLEVEDTAGQVASVTWVGTFRAGVSGVVRQYDVPEARVAGAQVTLVDAASGEQVGADTTDARGRFDVDLPEVPGAFALTVEAEGFVTHTRTLEVGDESREALDVALARGEDGVWSIRFIEPDPGAIIEAETTNVSGVVSGIEVAHVRVNGKDALLLGESAFLVKVPVAEGTNVFHVEAESAEGHVVTAQVEVTRPMSVAVGKSCAAVPGLSLAGLLALLGLARARRAKSGRFQAAAR